MIEALERHLDSNFPYCFNQGPAEVPDKKAAEAKGLNCIALAHLVLEDLFGRKLPPDLHCFEMFSDKQMFTTVDATDDMLTGDLLWMGPRSPKVPLAEFKPKYDQSGSLVNWRDNPIKHVGIYTGEQTDDYLLLHATHYEGTTAVWPLQQFTNYRRYEHIYRISRLVV